MCGISAIIGPRSDGLREAVCKMVDVQTHRGPDGRGVYVDQAGPATFVALGHNRLSIIDLTDHAAQPMVSRDGRYVLVYNGEVYNYREIARDLDACDLDEGCGDTAVVLAALAKWGPAALSRFNGMWALAMYDRVAHTLLVSRDRFGVKPLYYARSGDRLIFASEIKAILQATDARFAINADVAVPYLTRGLLNFGEGTFFKDIQQFPAASFALLDLQQLPVALPEPTRFWWHPFEQGHQPSAGAVTPDEIRSVFLDAVALRLRSDVPVGVLLSGGVDSSSIVGAIAHAGSLENVTILSVTSDDPNATEEPFIDRMAAFNRLTPQKINVSRDPMSLLDRLPESCWYNDEPVCGVADIAHRRLMELARARGIKVLLSGQGADEQLGGYNKFLFFWLQALIGEGKYGSALKTLAQFARHSNTLYEFRLHEAIRYLGRSRLSSNTFIAPAHQGRDTVDIGFQGSYPKREWIDLVKTSVPALLHYEDRMSMSQSVEVRVPFLDYRLVECLARVHPSEKFAGGWTKAIFRQAIEGLVPREIQYRRDKKGFNVPETPWMRTAFQPHVTERFGAPMMSEALGLIDSARLRDAYARFLTGRSYLNGRHFFRVLAFEAFLRRFENHLTTAAAA